MKRVPKPLAILLCSVLMIALFSGFLVAQARPGYRHYPLNTRAPFLGDINSDGEVDSKDALCVLQITVSLISENDFPANNIIHTDLNGSRTIDTEDALLILQYSVYLFEYFPRLSPQYPEGGQT